MSIAKAGFYTPPIFFNNTVQKQIEITPPQPPEKPIPTLGIQPQEQFNDFGTVLFEKYRPQTFNEIIGQNDIVQQIQKNIRNLPHMIFKGPPGTGKTTLAQVIALYLNADIIILNGSDDRGINTIRGKVLNFVKHGSLHNRLKIIFFDEADGLTQEAQDALKSIMERYPRTVRYVFACNDIEAFIEPLRSRCNEYDFKRVLDSDIILRLHYINDKENLGNSNDVLQQITIKAKGDMRKAINLLQGGG